MFRPARSIVDVTVGHGCGAITTCLSPLVNQFVYHLGFFKFLTLGDTFNLHSCAGLDSHAPIVVPTTCSTRVFIKNLPMAIASPNHVLGCGDNIFPDPNVKIFIGS